MVGGTFLESRVQLKKRLDDLDKKKILLTFPIKKVVTKTHDFIE